MKKTKIAIITTCSQDWGGSEDLWAKSIPFLQSFGFEISVYKNKINAAHQEFIKLSNLGVSLIEFSLPFFSLYTRIKRRLLNFKKQKIKIPYNDHSYLENLLVFNQPDLVIISQGINFDGLAIGFICAAIQIKYVLIAQKAVDFFWPYYTERKHMLNVYQQAERCYFISKNNLRLTEEQFGIRLSNAEIQYNPIKVSRKFIPMPQSDTVIRLACVGRLFLLDKGQDILIRILSAPKWRERPVAVSFIGEGIDKEGLQEMAALLAVTNIEFLTPVAEIETVWQQYHALILPSRSEGMPLVLLEAMACGRTCIVSTAGGNCELVTDGVTGFIGNADETSFDKAMERAWRARENWNTIGFNAHNLIKDIIPRYPEENLSISIKNILHA